MEFSLDEGRTLDFFLNGVISLEIVSILESSFLLTTWLSDKTLDLFKMQLSKKFKQVHF